MESKELKHLLILLDDPDQMIYHTVKENLLNQGADIIPDLEKAWEGSFSTVFQERIEEIIQQIQFSNTRKHLHEWFASSDYNLLKGAYWVAKYQYPDLAYEDVHSKVQKIKNDIWLELNEFLTAYEKINVINHFLFKVLLFSGNTVNPHTPQNAFINQVLETKRGNSISLAVFYACIAQELDLPVFGVDLPRNFILAFNDTQPPSITGENNPEILFYINPFNKGAVFGKNEIEYYIRQKKLKQNPAFFKPCSNKTMIRRLIQSLILSYEKLGYKDKAEQMTLLLGDEKNNA